VTDMTEQDPARGSGPSGASSATGPEVTLSSGTNTGATTAPAAQARRPEKAPRQTLAGRVWVALACAAILLVLVIIFIAENSHSVTVSFLGAHGHISEALALLIAVVVGIVITLLIGSARIVQLSLQVRRERRRQPRSS
jgi:uncharacterized integral membrane protein